MINKKYVLEVEILTPINIGAGREKDWMRGVDFVEKEGKIYVLNLRKIIQQGVDIDKITSYFENRKDQKIISILGNKLLAASDKVFDNPATTTNDIKPFIKNELSGKPIVPGSSLKGAVRSILFKYLRKHEREVGDVLGNIKEGNDFMRFIKISDFSFDRTELVNTKIFNLQNSDGYWEGGWKHKMNNTTNTFSPTGFNTIYESIEVGDKGFGTIMLSETTFNFLGKEEQKYGDLKSQMLDIKNLFQVINEHTREYLIKEKSFFEQYPTERSDKIEDSISSLLELIPENNSCCILKMSAGVGFHSITGDWQFNDYVNTGSWKDGKRKYKSRKIAIHHQRFSLMGFVKMRVISEEEIIAMEREKLEKQQRGQELIQEKIREEKVMREEIERIKSQFRELISLGDKEGNKAEALKFFVQASVLCPEEEYPKNQINELNEVLEKERLQMEEETRKRREAEKFAERRRIQIEGGLSFLSETYPDGRCKVTDFKGLKSRVENWMKKANQKVLPESESDILIESLKRIYQGIVKDKDRNTWGEYGAGVWLHVENWVNPEKAKSIFEQVVNSK